MRQSQEHEKDPALDIPQEEKETPEAVSKIDAIKKKIILDPRKKLNQINSELESLRMDEEELKKSLNDMRSEGGYTEETIDHAQEALKESVTRIETRIQKLENHRQSLERYEEQEAQAKELRTKFMMTFGMITGADAGMLLVDKGIKKVLSEEAAERYGLFTPEERIQMWQNKAKATKFLVTVCKPFLPGWGKALAVGGGKFVEYSFNLMAEHEDHQNKGEKMKLKDIAKFTWGETFGKAKKKDLEDPEKVKQAGEAITEYSEEFEGELGEKIKALGKQFEEKPEETGKKLVALQEKINKEGFAEDENTDEVLEGIAPKDELSRTEKMAEKAKEMAKDSVVWTGKKAIELTFYVPGVHDTARVLDRYIGGLINKEKGGVIFTRADHARIARNQSKIGKYGVKAIGLFWPTAKLALPLAKGREKFEDMKYQLAKEGKEMSIPEQMSEIAKLIPEKKLKDEKTIKEIGKLVKAAGRDIGDTTGEVIEQVGEFIIDNPKVGSTMLIHLRKLVIDRELKPDEHAEVFAGNMAKNWNKPEIKEEMGEFEVDDNDNVVEVDFKKKEEKITAKAA